MRVEGKIASWNDDKGYGFIAPVGGGSQVFVHIKAFRNRGRRPAVDDAVTYDIAKDRQGRIRAGNATLLGDKQAGGRGLRLPKATAAVFVSSAFLAVVGWSARTGQLPPLILQAYLAASALTFFVYALDKSAAKHGRGRTSEKALHLLALAGGWPGAWIAQQSLRHKSRKTGFRAVFRVTVLLNCGGLAWLHTPGGQAVLNQLLG